MKPHTHSLHDTPTSPSFFTAAELAARWRVTPMTLRRWRNAGKLKTHHLGRGIRFSMAEVERLEREAIA
ncbi:MAG: helix-turn-helix domain-containing protein [Prosthecobacter sp.]